LQILLLANKAISNRFGNINYQLSTRKLASWRHAHLSYH